MKGVKGRILKKLKAIPKLGDTKQTPRVLRVHASDGLPSPSPPLGPRYDLEAPPRPCSGPAGRFLRELPVGKEQQQLQDQQQQHGPHSPNHKAEAFCKSPPPLPEPDIIYVAELMRDLEDDKDEDPDDISDKENVRPAPTVPWSSVAAKDRTPPPPDKGRPPSSSSSHSGNREFPLRWCATPTSDHLEGSPFRRPDSTSDSLFDPDLLAAFEEAVMDHIRSYEEFHRNKARSSTAVEEQNKEEQNKEEEDGEDDGTDIDQEQPPSKVPRIQTADLNEEQEGNEVPSGDLEPRCPPGGANTVVLYTTTLRGIRKTFEDCRSLRFLLGSLRVRFCERDVSMHLGYREELWRVLGGRAVPPRLFVRGRYIGSADEVLGLHERGHLLPLLRGLPADAPSGVTCGGCGGVGFVLCAGCSGSRKMLVGEGRRGEATRCPCCNENGLVVCVLCSCFCNRSVAGGEV